MHLRPLAIRSLCIGSFLITAALAASVAAEIETEPSPPNVILIMADDLGAEGLGCYGSTSYRTPHLDAMAAAGIRFDNAYATPLCTPTRAMIMSGLYPQITGHRGLISKDPEVRMSPDIKTFGHSFREAGYATAIAGKWQLGQFDTYPDHPVEMGFDQYCLWKWFFKKTKTSRYYEPGIWQNGASVDGGESDYGPDRYSQFLMDFIRQQKDERFFVYYPMALTHSPFIDPPPLPGDNPQVPGDNPSFARMITYADAMVGKIRAFLDALEIAENTLVIFTADNGTDKRIKDSKLGDLTVPGGKGSMTEAGTRVPFIAQWPAVVEAGQVSDKLISLVDLVPTFNALAGIQTDASVTGRDLSHYLTGREGEDRDHIFVCYGQNYFARTDKWRLHNTGDLYFIPNSSNEERYAEKKKESAKHRAKLQAILDSYEMDSYSNQSRKKANRKD